MRISSREVDFLRVRRVVDSLRSEEHGQEIVRLSTRRKVAQSGTDLFDCGLFVGHQADVLILEAVICQRARKLLSILGGCPERWWCTRACSQARYADNDGKSLARHSDWLGRLATRINDGNRDTAPVSLRISGLDHNRSFPSWNQNGLIERRGKTASWNLNGFSDDCQAS